MRADDYTVIFDEYVSATDIESVGIKSLIENVIYGHFYDVGFPFDICHVEFTADIIKNASVLLVVKVSSKSMSYKEHLTSDIKISDEIKKYICQFSHLRECDSAPMHEVIDCIHDNYESSIQSIDKSITEDYIRDLEMYSMRLSLLAIPAGGQMNVPFPSKPRRGVVPSFESILRRLEFFSEDVLQYCRYKCFTD